MATKPLSLFSLWALARRFDPVSTFQTLLLGNHSFEIACTGSVHLVDAEIVGLAPPFLSSEFISYISLLYYPFQKRRSLE